MTEPTRPYRWRVYLGVSSSGPTAEQLSARLGLPGAQTSSVPHRRWPHLWDLDSGLPPTAELDEHLDALTRRCLPAADAIADLVGRPDCRVRIEAVLRLESPDDEPSMPSMWIPPDTVTFAARCGIGIDIDGYVNRGARPAP